MLRCTYLSLVISVVFLTLLNSTSHAADYAVKLYSTTTCTGTNISLVQTRNRQLDLTTAGLNWQDGTSMANSVRCVIVRPGYEIKLCTSANFGGSCQHIDNVTSTNRTQAVTQYNSIKSFGVKRMYYFQMNFYNAGEPPTQICANPPTSVCFKNVDTVTQDGYAVARIWYNLTIPNNTIIMPHSLNNNGGVMSSSNFYTSAYAPIWSQEASHTFSPTYTDYTPTEVRTDMFYFSLSYVRYLTGGFRDSRNPLFNIPAQAKPIDFMLFSTLDGDGTSPGRWNAGSIRVDQDATWFNNETTADNGHPFAHETFHDILAQKDLGGSPGIWEGMPDWFQYTQSMEYDNNTPFSAAAYAYPDAPGDGWSFSYENMFASQLAYSYNASFFWQFLGSAFVPSSVINTLTDWDWYAYFYTNPTWLNYGTSTSRSLFFWSQFNSIVPDPSDPIDPSQTPSPHDIINYINQTISGGHTALGAWSNLLPKPTNVETAVCQYAISTLDNLTYSEKDRLGSKYSNPEFSISHPENKEDAVLPSITFSLGTTSTPFTIIVKAELGYYQSLSDKIRFYIDTDTAGNRPSGKTWDSDYTSSEECYAYGLGSTCYHSDLVGNRLRVLDEYNNGVTDSHSIPITMFIPSTAFTNFAGGGTGTHFLVPYTKQSPRILSITIVRGLVAKPTFHGHPRDICLAESQQACLNLPTDVNIGDPTMNAGSWVIDSEGLTPRRENFGYETITPFLHRNQFPSFYFFPGSSIQPMWKPSGFSDTPGYKMPNNGITKVAWATRVEATTTDTRSLRYLATNTPYLSSATVWARSGPDISSVVYASLSPMQSIIHSVNNVGRSYKGATVTVGYSDQALPITNGTFTAGIALMCNPPGSADWVVLDGANFPSRFMLSATSSPAVFIFSGVQNCDKLTLIVSAGNIDSTSQISSAKIRASVRLKP